MSGSVSSPHVHILATDEELDGTLEPFETLLSPFRPTFTVAREPTFEAFVEQAADADLIISAGRRAGHPIDRRMIESLNHCRAIALCIVGSDRVDLEAATERGIPVTNVPDVYSQEVADHTMALLLAAWRRLPELNRMSRDGRWTLARPMLYELPRLQGQTLGFIGFGNVARAVARRARAFGLRMVGHDPYLDETTLVEHDVEPVELMELLERSDFVSLHAPGSEVTRGMITAAHFARMKPTAIFLNTARGTNVDEPALIEALRAGRIAGAALDVAATEPIPKDHPFVDMPQVVLTPHIGSASSRTPGRRKEVAAREAALVLEGLWPRHCVNPWVLSATSLRRWQPIPSSRGKTA